MSCSWRVPVLVRPRGCIPERSPPAAGTACGWAGSHTAHLDQVLRATDLVVAVCDNAHENLDPHLPRLHWSIPDPVRVGIDEAFDAAYDQINRRIHLLVDATPAGPANESRILP